MNTKILSLISPAVILLSTSVAHSNENKKAKKSVESNCSVPGELLHWEVEHCFMKLGTDDYTGNHVAIQKCLGELTRSKDYPKDECTRKVYLKTEFCKFLMMGQKTLKLQECMKSNKYTPRTVVNGGVES